MSKTIAKVWKFASKSNPNKSYETLQYTDGSTSCNCRGWTFAKNGVRTCRHTQAVENGTADQICDASYTAQAQGAAKQEAKYQQKAAEVKKAIPIRKVNWQ